MTGQSSSKVADLETKWLVQYGLLTAISLLAVILRFYKLGEWSFWIDEIFTLNNLRAHYFNLNDILRNIPPARDWLSLSLILSSGALNIFGTNEWSARLVPAVIGSISIPILYFPIKALLGAVIGLISVLLLAVSPWHLFWSQNARFYTSLMLFYALAIFLTFLGLERGRSRYILFALLCLYLATGERLTGLFYVPVLISYFLVLLVFRLNGPHVSRWKYYGAIVLVPILIFGISDFYRYLTGHPSTLSAILDTFAGQSNHSPFRLLLSIIYRIGLPVFVLGIFGGVYMVIRNQRLGLFVVAAALVPIILLVMASPFVFTVDRYIFVALPFWMILSAAAIQGLLSGTDGPGQWLALGVFVFLLFNPMSEDFLYYQYQNGGRPDWKNALQLVQRNLQPGDLVLSTRPEVGKYYFSGDVGNVNSFDLEANGWEGRRIWFLIDEATGWVNPPIKEWILKNGELIEVVQVSVPGRDMPIRIYLSDPANQRK